MVLGSQGVDKSGGLCYNHSNPFSGGLRKGFVAFIIGIDKSSAYDIGFNGV